MKNIIRNTLILYKSYDSDLLGLLDQVGLREWGRLLKESLRVLIRPGYIPKHIAPQKLNPYQKDDTKVMINICITGENDADIIELLNHVKARKFGSFCKMALRFYIGRNNALETMLDVALLPEILIPIYQTQYLVSNVVSVPKKKTIRKRNTKPKKTKQKEIKEIDINLVETKDIEELPITPVFNNPVLNLEKEISYNDQEQALVTKNQIPEDNNYDYYNSNNENNIEFDDEPITFTEEKVKSNDEDDILSLLEGMM